MTFAENIKYVRTKLHISQEELAHELGVSFATVNRWENGNYSPSRLARRTFDSFCQSKNITFEDNDE